MKIYISVDMEGLAGISMWNEVAPRQSKESFDILYEHLRALLQGLFESGKVDYVLISDSHAAGDNVYYRITEEFENVEIAHGPLRKDFMMIGLDKTFDRVVFLGYHAGVGSRYGIMDHTYSSSVIHDLWINGQRMNEAIINAAFAGYHGVPIALIIGDNILQKELKESLKGEYIYVVTKQSTGKFSAIMRSKSVVMKQIKDAAQRAAQIRKNKLPVVKFTPPIEMKIVFNDTYFADAVELMPKIERIDGRTVIFRDDDYSVVFNAIMAIVFLAKGVKGIGG